VKISVVIRTLNEEKNIKNCLEHLARQSLQPAEVLLVDNNSSDETIANAETFSGRLPIRIIQNPVVGFATGLNLGFREAKSDWIAYLSADCYPDTHWLYWLARSADELAADVIHDHSILHPQNDITYVLSAEAGPVPKKPVRIDFFSNTNILYRRSALAMHLPFTGVGRFGYAEDTIMSIEFMKHNRTAYMEPRAVSYNKSFSTTTDFKKRMVLHGQMEVALLKKFPSKPRLYLNSLYWSLRELILFLQHRDRRFLSVASIRFAYTTTGIVHELFSRDPAEVLNT
jgi:glycosyltransferase involved in cell wall biosynthesis